MDRQSDDQLVVARWQGGPEIFASFQGEGRHAGQPCVFLRLSRCNLYCVWCDTDYTWNWVGTPFVHRRDQEPGYRKYDPVEETVRMPAAAVAETLRRFPQRHLVITGGEPLLQQAGLTALLGALAGESWFVEVETNGTIVPVPQLDRWISQYNVSPKLENSQVPLRLRYRPDVIDAFAANPKADFKFVAESEADLEEVDRLVEQHRIARDRVWIMPQAMTPKELSAGKAKLAQPVARRGYHLGDRLHVALFGAKRGV